MKITKSKLRNIIRKTLVETATPGMGLFQILLKTGYDYVDAFNVLYPFKLAKDEAGLKGSDKYFHYLAFHALGSEIRENKKDISKDDALALGGAKELYDALGFGDSDPEDQRINELGLTHGLEGKPPTIEAIDLMPDRSDATNKMLDSEKYSHIHDFEGEAADFYKEGGKFIQPRYNIFLGPDLRKLAYQQEMGAIPDFAYDFPPGYIGVT